MRLYPHSVPPDSFSNLHSIHSIYKKSLVLSNDERGGRLTGDIVNLQSTDSTRLQELCTYGQVAWSGLFQITLAFVSLYNLLGWTMFVGGALLLADRKSVV